MKKKEILKITEAYVKRNCDDVSAHDWWHIQRVQNIAKEINKHEAADEFVVQMIVLLHDVFDWKFHPDADVKKELVKLLEDLNVKAVMNRNDIENIVHSVSHLGFNGGFENNSLSIEGQIAYDADKIDAMGAIGIARLFAYGGKMNRSIYNPEQGIVESKNEEDYKYSDRTSISHFYEKLLKLRDYIGTDTGRKIAEKRHKFMKKYLEAFFQEWNAKDLDK